MSGNEGRWAGRDGCAPDEVREQDEKDDDRDMSTHARLEAIAELLALGLWRRRTGRLKVPESLHLNRERDGLERGADRHLDLGDGTRGPHKGECP